MAEEKTNVMRILDQKRVPYTCLLYTSVNLDDSCIMRKLRHILSNG